MPHKREGSPFWYISYTNASGQRIRESSGTTVRKEAEELERRRKSEAWAKARLGQEPARTVEEVLLEYLNHLGDTPAGERARHAAKPLYQHFQGQTTIAPEQIVAYRRNRNRAPATIRKELSVLSAAFNYCRRDLGWGIENPLAGRLGKKPEGRIRWITRAEADALIAAARRSEKAPYLWAFIQLGLFSGMRKGELLGLEWSRVDMDAELVYLRPKDQKGKRYDSVPLNRRAIEAVRSLQGEHARWVFSAGGQRIQNVRRSFATACKNAGIEDFHIHDMRHTCAAWLVQAGVPLREVAEILRHRDIRTTMIYSHLAPDSAKKAISALD